MEKSSEFWFDYEAERCVYYHFNWNKNDFKNVVENCHIFLQKYIDLTQNYGILSPVNGADNLDDFIKLEKTKLPDYWICFNSLYLLNNVLVYPSIMFIYENEAIKKVDLVNIDLLTTYEDFQDNNSSAYAFPVSILLSEDYSKNNMVITISIDNDAFLSNLDNKKTKNRIDTFDNNTIIDNSELAYLNTSRLNSFLKDFKILCQEYKVTSNSIENLYDNDSNNPQYFSSKGIFINNEVVFYEDVYDLLPTNYRI